MIILQVQSGPAEDQFVLDMGVGRVHGLMYTLTTAAGTLRLSASTRRLRRGCRGAGGVADDRVNTHC